MLRILFTYVTLFALCKWRSRQFTLDPCCTYIEGDQACGHVLHHNGSAIFGWYTLQSKPPGCHTSCASVERNVLPKSGWLSFFNLLILTAEDWQRLLDRDGHTKLSCTDTDGDKIDLESCVIVSHKFEKKIRLYDCPSTSLNKARCFHKKFSVQVKKVPFEQHHCLPYKIVKLYRVILHDKRPQQPSTIVHTAVKSSATTLKGTTRVAPKLIKQTTIHSKHRVNFSTVLKSTSTTKISKKGIPVVRETFTTNVFSGESTPLSTQASQKPLTNGNSKVRTIPSRPENSTMVIHAPITKANNGFYIAISITAVIICIGAIGGTWILRRTKEKRRQVDHVQASPGWTLPVFSSTKKRQVAAVTAQKGKKPAASAENSCLKQKNDTRVETFIHWSDPRAIPLASRPQINNRMKKDKDFFTKKLPGRTVPVYSPTQKRLGRPVMVQNKKTPVSNKEKLNSGRKFNTQASVHRTDPRFMSLYSGHPKDTETFVHWSDPRIFRPNPTEGCVNEDNVEGRKS